MSDFSVGDRVRCIVDHPDGNRDIVIGSEGVVARVINCGSTNIGVEWDDRIRAGHNLDYRILSHRGWYVSKNEIELVLDLDVGDNEMIDSFLAEFSCKAKE